jgi:hypothetical protein
MLAIAKNYAPLNSIISLTKTDFKKYAFKPLDKNNLTKSEEKQLEMLKLINDTEWHNHCDLNFKPGRMCTRENKKIISCSSKKDSSSNYYLRPLPIDPDNDSFKFDYDYISECFFMFFERYFYLRFKCLFAKQNEKFWNNIKDSKKKNLYDIASKDDFSFEFEPNSCFY